MNQDEIIEKVMKNVPEYAKPAILKRVKQALSLQKDDYQNRLARAERMSRQELMERDKQISELKAEIEIHKGHKQEINERWNAERRQVLELNQEVQSLKAERDNAIETLSSFRNQGKVLTVTQLRRKIKDLENVIADDKKMIDKYKKEAFRIAKVKDEEIDRLKKKER